MSATTNLDIIHIEPGQTDKEAEANTGFDKLDAALCTTTTVSFAGGDVTLTATQFRGAIIFACTGATASRDLNLPAVARMFGVVNDSGQAIVLVRGSTELTLDDGDRAIYGTDGTANGLARLSTGAGGGGGGGGAQYFVDLYDTFPDYTGRGGEMVIVSASEDGLETMPIPDFVEEAPEDGVRYARKDAGWVTIPGGGGVSDFVDLGDVPASYTGEAGKVATVKGDETGLEFTTITGPVPNNGMLSVFVPGLPDDGGLMAYVVAPVDFTMADDFAGSVGECITNPTATAVFDVLKNGSSIGSVSISTGGVFTFSTTGGAVTITAGDDIRITAPSPQDATLADVSINLLMTRAAGAGIVVAFGDLSDVPASYTGQALKGARVNAGETALEYYTRAFIGLADVPANFTSAGLKYVRVNAGATALEFQTFPTLVTAFTGLSDVPSSYSGQALKGVRVNAGATALEFYTQAFIGLSDVPASFSGQASKGVRVNAGATALEFYTIPAAGATAFTGLSDVPASYSGGALKYVRVNAGATALEFTTFPTLVTAFTGLSDVPASYSGQGSKGVRVNSGATALEFYTQAFIGLSDVPANFTSSGLKYVRVNSGATALEFTTFPTLVTAFTGLSDVPASYSGQGLKGVRVNSGATALEFFTRNFIGLGDVPANFTAAGNKALGVNSGATAVEFVVKSSGFGMVDLIADSGAISAATSFDFVMDDATYAEYDIVLENVRPTTTNTQLSIRVSVNSGSTYDSGNNYSKNRVFRVSGGAAGASGDDDLAALNAEWGIANGQSNSASYSGVNGWVTLNGQAAAAHTTKGTYANWYVFDGGTQTGFLTGGFTYVGTSKVTNARVFYVGSTTIASGRIRVYGKRKA